MTGILSIPKTALDPPDIMFLNDTCCWLIINLPQSSPMGEGHIFGFGQKQKASAGPQVAAPRHLILHVAFLIHPLLWCVC